MAKTIRDLFATADGSNVSVALLSIAALASFAVVPTVVPVLRWVASSVRLEMLLRRSKHGESNSGDGVTVSGLFIHPVKSMRSVSLSVSGLDQKGLRGDRRFMVVYELPLPVYKTKWDEGDTSHRFLTQRQCPSLATVSATIETTAAAGGEEEEQQRVLVLSVQELAATKAIRIPLRDPKRAASSPPTKTLFAGIWDDVVAVDDMGEEAAAFLQGIADADGELSASTTEGATKKKTVRLVTASTSEAAVVASGADDRSYVPGYAKTWRGGYLGKPTLTDGFPVLIASEASLEALNRKLGGAGRDTIPMSRFRPNIVVRGKSLESFEEDRWKVIAIGDVVFAIVKACPRCKQSCTDQITGTVSPEMEPLETMKSFRRSSEGAPENGAVFFAQNAIPIGRLEGKTIGVGDPVRILETGDPVYID
mmetsp:Transcript_17363/g.35676  ORF Transcript_17363/g.35676 Transcript_17363/m.35676 type:complete len:422 (+) Transcript_17363:91-1356(+)|eukprot:CAMPEP_0201132160 /NCGR_PEP_ID=MMETSP0850-20130426/44998_1 /ASSEMBLY_ACC=CAM_ASM_000622 /TAXON_ID=183588 /ORGANISM="Pseudo-nitzschia fraudulenta, Strain WWA7" /LENGTH=421 /DNA_ID=CAMNT_0047402427 /DNA_START=54 /DNA_END=1319 /DNA_ORIENTATION=-